MRPVDPIFLERLSAPGFDLCLVQILTLSDGRYLGFTDWDEDLTVAGSLCRARASLRLERGRAEAEHAGAVEVFTQLDLTGAGLAPEACLGAGLEIYWVSPKPTLLAQKVFAGQVSGLSQGDDLLKLELTGPLSGLDRPVGRVLSRLCDAKLGDGRCRVNVSDPNWAGKTCDKRYETCRDVFGNLLNFRGFPDLPGRVFQSRFAEVSAGARDGGSRRR